MLTTKNLQCTINSSADCGELHIKQSGNTFAITLSYPKDPACPMLVVSREELYTIAGMLEEIASFTQQ